MNSRWSVEEEKMLINDIKNNKSFQELSLKYNRSPNALELRIKKIIYDNISANKSIKLIGGHLNLPEDKIKQYYYSYKEMLEKNPAQHPNKLGYNLISEEIYNYIVENNII